MFRQSVRIPRLPSLRPVNLVLVLVLFLLSVASAFVGLIVVFPVLGHATWHAYKAMR